MLKKQLHDEGNGRDHLVRTVFNRSKEITLLKYQKPAPVTEDSHQVPLQYSHLNLENYVDLVNLNKAFKRIKRIGFGKFFFFFTDY